MTLQHRSILIVDDSPEDRMTFERLLRGDPEIHYVAQPAETVSEGLALCRQQRFDAILLDHGLPDDSGLEFLARLIDEHGPNVFAVVMITGLADVSVAAKAMKLGAQDYLIKGMQLGRHLNLAINSAIEKAELQRQVERQRLDLEVSHARLTQLVATLDRERAALAQRVEERTADLSRANAALGRAMRMKDEFLANMSHELRTPLTAVLGRTETLLEEIYGPVTEQQRAALDVITESAQHLLALITDVLDLSKLGVGKLQLELELTPVDIICRQSMRLVDQAAASKQITLSITADSAVEVIRADARRLKQILVNLLSNAVKFTKPGGSVGLEVHGDPIEQTATFTVWDTGIGIAATDLEQLFQPFVQIDSSLTRHYAGAGLGLALVRQLVDAHGGSVTVESTPGRGSRFSVTLAWAPTQADLHAPQQSEPDSALAHDPPLQSQPLILLADDNQENLHLLSDYLLAHGFRIAIAQNGREAIDQALAVRPDLIIMDIQMPVISGLDAIRRISADQSLAHTPIIALTALAMPGDRERCIGAGAHLYLAKPVSLGSLLRTIRGHLPTPSDGE